MTSEKLIKQITEMLFPLKGETCMIKRKKIMQDQQWKAESLREGLNGFSEEVKIAVLENALNKLTHAGKEAINS